MTATRAVVGCERRTSAARAGLLLALAVYERARLVHVHEPGQLAAAVLLARRLGLPLVATGDPGDPGLSVADLVLAPEPTRELGARAAELEEQYLALLATGRPAPARAPLPSLPTVGIVVVTHQRRDLLIRTLDALAAQTYPRELMDVVVVDNGTSDGSSEVLAHADVRVSLPPTQQHTLRGGGAARIGRVDARRRERDRTAKAGPFARHVRSDGSPATTRDHVLVNPSYRRRDRGDIKAVGGECGRSGACCCGERRRGKPVVQPLR